MVAFLLTVMHYVYIIESLSNGRWYYGLTSDLRNRLDAHTTSVEPTVYPIASSVFFNNAGAVSFKKKLMMAPNATPNKAK